MKRKLLILLTMLLPLFTLYGEEVTTNEKATIETFIKVYEIQNTYSEHDTVKITIHYFPITKQARVFYVDESSMFDYSDAVVSLKRCLEEFTKQIGCYHYKRYRDDEEQNFKFANKKYTRIISYVNFSE